MNECVIIDFSLLFYRHFYGNRQAVIDNPEFLSHLLLTSIYKTIKKFKINTQNKLVLAIDCHKRDCWRTSLFEKECKNLSGYEDKSYKGHRTKDETVNWEALFKVSRAVEDICREATDILVIRHPMAEGDCVIYVGSTIFDKTIIISTDGDFKQLLSNSITQYDPIREVFFSQDIPSDDYLKIHIFTGDKSDGILSCRSGWGKVTVQKNLKDMDAFLDKESGVRERYEFNEKLIDLSKIPDNIQKEIKTLYEEPQGCYDSGKLIKFFRKYHLQKTAEDMHLLKAEKVVSVDEFF